MNHEAGGGDEFLMPARGSLCAGRAIPGVLPALTASGAGISPLLSQREEPPASAASGAWTSGGVFPLREFCFQRRKHGQIPTVFFHPDG